jgi:hypothetical protein
MKHITSLIFILFLAVITALGCSTAVAVKSPGKTPLKTEPSSPLIKPVAEIEKEGPIFSKALSPDGLRLALGSSKKIEVWNVIKKTKLWAFESQGRDISSLAFSPDGSILAAGSYQVIELWDMKQGVRIDTFLGPNDYVTALAFSADGRLLVSGSKGAESAIHVWNVSEKKVVNRLTYETQYAEMVVAIAISADGGWVASVGLSRKVRVWNMKMNSSSPDQEFEPSATSLAVAFHPDGKTLAVGTFDGQVVLYELAGGKIGRTLTGHTGKVTSIGYSADGATLVSASLDGTVIRWAMETGVKINSKKLDQDTQSIAISADGMRVVAIGHNGAAVFTLKEKEGVPPMIAIFTPTHQQTVEQPKIRLTGQILDDVGVVEIGIDVNGVPLGDSSGMSDKERDLKVQPEPNVNQRKIALDRLIPLIVGQNRITVTAYDQEGLSNTDTVEITYEAEKGKVYAAVIGISRYKNAPGLKYADEDALAFYEYLLHTNNVPKEQVTLLQNEEATLENVKSLLGEVIKRKARKQDTVIIYYAGHGVPEPDSNSLDGDGLEKYLVPYDADPNRLYSTALPMEDMAKIFSKLSAERVILIQDTCYSGSSGEGRTVQTAFMTRSVSGNFLDRVAKGEGRVIITASRANEVSLERDDLRHGVFTYYLLEAFRHGDSDGDGFISANEAFDYVSREVPKATGQNQNPVMKGEIVSPIILGKVVE